MFLETSVRFVILWYLLLLNGVQTGTELEYGYNFSVILLTSESGRLVGPWIWQNAVASSSSWWFLAGEILTHNLRTNRFVWECLVWKWEWVLWEAWEKNSMNNSDSWNCTYAGWCSLSILEFFQIWSCLATLESNFHPELTQTTVSSSVICSIESYSVTLCFQRSTRNTSLHTHIMKYNASETCRFSALHYNKNGL